LARLVTANNRRMATRAADAKAPNPRPLADEPWAGPVARGHEAVRAEWDRFEAAGGVLPSITDLLDEDQGQDGTWRAGLLVSRGRPVGPLAAEFPETLAVLEGIPGLWSALFSVLEPGTELPEHHGSNAGVLRYHLGIRCEGDTALSVGGHEVPYRDGVGVLFDDTAPHSAWNRSETPRVTLFVELLRPAGPVVGTANRLVQRLIAMDPRYRDAPRRATELHTALLRRPLDAPSTPAPPELAPPRRCEAGPTLADPDRQDELERFGYTVVRLFDEEVLATVDRLTTELGPAPDDPQVALNWSFHSRSQEHKDAVKDLLPAVRPALEATFADQEVYLTTFITKWPGPHGAFPPHQDPTLVDERRHTGVTVWAPLVDVGPDNGMLHVVPGSHRFSSAYRVQDVDRSPFAGLEEAIVAEHGRGIPLAAGEALVFDNRLIHYSLPNTSTEARIVLSFGLRPRAGYCVVVVPDGDEGVAIHRVQDDFYIDVLPARRDHWVPEDEPLARLSNPVESWAADDFAALCAAVGDGPRTVVARPATAVAEAIDAGVFCALCGSSEGLSEADRQGRTNAQLRCASCEAALATHEHRVGHR
jgi:beta-hydroxylase